MAAKRDPEAAPEIVAAFRPETATPDQVEQLIDYRIAQIDEQIKSHLAAVEELRTERKRWVGVTGGRSRVNGKEEEET